MKAHLGKIVRHIQLLSFYIILLFYKQNHLSQYEPKNELHGLIQYLNVRVNFILYLNSAMF